MRACSIRANVHAFTSVVALLALVAVSGPAHAQWPHLAGQPLRSGPIHADADGNVYVVNPDADTVTRLGPAAGGVQPKIWEQPAGDYPRTLTLWGDSILTANQDADTVTQLAKADGAPRRTVARTRVDSSS